MRETGTGQQVVQFLDCYMMTIKMMILKKVHKYTEWEVTPYSIVLLVKLIFAVLSNYSSFIKFIVSLPCPSEPATVPYPKPDESSLCSHILLLQISF
jgi:hypothetical protein